MSLRHWTERVRDILGAIAEIDTFIAGMDYEDFRLDPKSIKAVTANFTIIGEASNHISESIRNRSPAIPWDQMRRMRNIVVHAYHGVDPQILWDTSKNDLPMIIPSPQRLLEIQRDC